MPQIPISNDPQVLNASSPVPIVSSESRRFAGEQISSLGGVARDLGETFQRAARVAAEEKKRLDVATAFNEYRKSAMMEMYRQAAAPPMDGDPDGTKTVTAFQSNLKDPMDTIASQIADPAIRAEFVNRANDFTLDLTQHVYANDIKKKSAANDVKLQQYVSQQGSFARETGAVDPIMKESEAFITASVDLMPAEKARRIQEMKESVIISGIDGHLEGKRWKEANDLLDTYGKGVFDEKKMGDLKNRIFNSEYTDATRTLTLDNQNAILEEKGRKKQGEMILNSALTDISSGDPVKARLALQRLDNAVAADMIDQKKVNNVMSSKVVRKQYEDTIKAGIFQQLLSGEIDASAANDAVAANFGDTLNLGQLGLIQMNIQQLSNRIQKDPGFAVKVRDGEGSIRALADGVNMQGLSPAEQLGRQRRISQLVGKYYGNLGQTALNDQDPTEMARSLIRETGLTPSVPPGANLQQLQEQRQKIFDAEAHPVFGRQAMGLSTTETRRKTQAELQRLTDQINQIQNGVK